jgi:hypothetical protein
MGAATIGVRFRDQEMIGDCSHPIVEATQVANVCVGERVVDVDLKVSRRCFFLFDKHRQRVLAVVADQRAHERVRFVLLIVAKDGLIKPGGVANILFRVSDRMLI